MTNLKIRLVKLISHAGFCSRRKAEILIKKGMVELNGVKIYDHVVGLDELKRLTINGKEIIFEPTKLWCFNKSEGLICSNSNQYNKKTIFDVLPKNLPRVVSVGRLDINSCGLILLTNNPSLSNFLEHPKNSISRKYEVIVSGKFKKRIIDEMYNGIKIKNIFYKPIKLKLLDLNMSEIKLEISLSEGKNREIRKIMNFFNLRVKNLKRIQYGPFKILDIKENKLLEVEKNILSKNLENLGFRDENNFR